MNTLLRDQLEQAAHTLQMRNADLQRANEELRKSRSEQETRERDWANEERAFNEYLTNEHNRLLTVWRSVVTMRRQFNELKLTTERDLNAARADLTRFLRNMHATCLNFAANQRGQESFTGVCVRFSMFWCL